MELETCHGCAYLEGFITEDFVVAECGESVWAGARHIRLGDDIARPARCGRYVARDAE